MNNFMKQNTRLITVVSILIIFITIAFQFATRYKYVSSKYSKYCYRANQVHHNIKNRLYYETLEECNKPLN